MLARFVKPEADEKDLIFTVVELNGDRATVRHDDSPMKIKPTFVYKVADLEFSHDGQKWVPFDRDDK